MHFCYLLFYIVVCIMGFVQNFAAIGMTMQNGTFGSNFESGSSGFQMMVLIVFCIFYFVAIYFAFQAYREFKGMLYDSGMGGGSGMGMMSRMGGGQPGGQNAAQGYNQASNRDDEGGAGGAPQNNQYAINNENSGSGFAAFRGQGVRLGGAANSAPD